MPTFAIYKMMFSKAIEKGLFLVRREESVRDITPHGLSPFSFLLFPLIPLCGLFLLIR